MTHKNERDPVTGQITTGHEWNGIKELNSPVPKIVFGALIIGAIYVAVWTVLMPAWPMVDSYTKGLLGIDQRDQVNEQVALARIEQAAWADAVASRPLEEVAADLQSMAVVREAGPTLFRDNCAACHAGSGTGQTGFPNIAEAPMMWGDGVDAIYQTVRVGINSGHPETRYAQMLAFGKDMMLPRADVSLLVDYVRFISGQVPADPEIEAAGAQLFAHNCASCHGADGTGVPEVGAPNLTDAYWTYGGDRDAIFQTIFYGRQGHMPHWEGRLSDTDIRILALYVSDLREERQ
ncbi:cytochrome-c oxidase, cbb3-type subunit III [Pelagibacterium halotolerans]|uniref:cytochrome-c oxidase, cbb3-type subunit III n=1 Tax=Pelagibacterium halotolerans TaxID=531813 RepID=UPI00384F0F6A